MHTLDLETSSADGDLSNGYALEPWRARQGKGFINSLHVYGDKHVINIKRPTREQLIEVLTLLAREEVYAHFALFDVAWLIASIEPRRMGGIPKCVRDIRWRDSALLTKWCINGRRSEFFSYSLLNIINTFKDKLGHPGADEFIRMKQEEVLSADDPYWDKRGQQDVLWTHHLVSFMDTQLPASCRRGYVIEARAIAQVANSWLVGMYVNQDAFKKAEDQIEIDIARGCEELGLSESTLSSPAQLGRVVFGDWGFTPLAKTPTGQPKADADTWILLAHASGDERLRKVLKTRQSLTLRSKYIRTVHEALARTGDGFLYGKPMLFGASTGRLTMSSETMSGMKVSMAQHQIPRKDKLVRAFLAPPPGYKLFETDAMAQESRIMGIWSGDENIIRIFNEGLNFHSVMAAEIYGMAYETFQAGYKAEANEGLEGIFTERRQMGKLTNLSCNFRIGGKKLAHKALVDYDTYMSEADGRRLVNTFKSTYRRIPEYWDNIVEFARQYGYTYTLAGRRWKAPQDMLNSSDAWKLEGTIISHPIQGTGGEMFLAATSSVPDEIMQTSLHDGVFWCIEEDGHEQEHADSILDRMNKTDYAQLWALNQPLSIPLLYEGSKIGSSYADVK